jgi:hypothetical protein
MKGRTEISPDHVNLNVAYAQLMRAFGTGEVDFSVEILSQLASISVRDGKVNERQLNFMFDVVKGIQPKDQLETMLAVQMAAIHSLTMTFAQRLANVDNILQQDIIQRALNRLARTFAAQMEALKRYRTAGEQKVTVEHVTVNDGGKAIVGSVMHGGRGPPKKGRRPHGRSLSFSEKPALLRDFKADKKAVPSSCSYRLDRLPVSRSKGRRPKGQTKRNASPRALYTGGGRGTPK